MTPSEGPGPIDLPAPPDFPVSLTVRVELLDSEPLVWRQLVLHGDLTLERVHSVLQVAMGWQDSHLHRFAPGTNESPWSGPYFLTGFDLQEGDEGTPEEDVRLDQVLRHEDDTLWYTYDFGDDWHHALRVESVDPMDRDSPAAVCTGGAMACPLEDVGGIPGHNNLVVEHQHDPTLSGLEDYLRDWVPDDWDPEALDLTGINEALGYAATNTELILSALAGIGLPPAFPPMVLPLVGRRANPDAVKDLASLVVSAATPAPGETPLTREEVAEVLHPFRFLLDLAGDDGIRLTAAGWMSPGVVRQVFDSLGSDHHWIGKGNREDQTAPVAELRRLCQDLGLLRKRKDRLLVTRKGRAATDPDTLWRVVAERLFADGDELTSAFRAVYGLHVAALGRLDHELFEDVAALLSRLGLRTGPVGVDRWDAMHICRGTRYVLAELVGGGGLYRAPGRTRHAVALARSALFGTSPTNPLGTPSGLQPQ